MKRKRLAPLISLILIAFIGGSLLTLAWLFPAPAATASSDEATFRALLDNVLTPGDSGAIRPLVPPGDRAIELGQAVTAIDRLEYELGGVHRFALIRFDDNHGSAEASGWVLCSPPDALKPCSWAFHALATFNADHKLTLWSFTLAALMPVSS